MSGLWIVDAFGKLSTLSHKHVCIAFVGAMLSVLDFKAMEYNDRGLHVTHFLFSSYIQAICWSAPVASGNFSGQMPRQTSWFGG